MAQNNNKKVFGIQAQNIGMSSMLFSAESVGFKAVEHLKDGVMVTEYLDFAAKTKKNITSLDYLTVNLSFGRAKDGDCVTDEFMAECPYLMVDSSIIEYRSPGTKKKNNDISKDSNEFLGKSKFFICYQIQLLTLFFFLVLCRTKLEELLTNKELDSDYFMGMNGGHQDALVSYFGNNRNVFIKKVLDNWPPTRDVFVQVLRGPEWRDLYKDDLPKKYNFPFDKKDGLVEWSQVNIKTPSSRPGEGVVERFLQRRLEMDEGRSLGGTTSISSSSSSLVIFKRDSVNCNVYIGVGNELTKDSTLRDVMRVANSSKPTLFIKRKGDNYELVLELKIGENQAIVYGKTDFDITVSAILNTRDVNNIANLFVSDREVSVIDTETYETVEF